MCVSNIARVIYERVIVSINLLIIYVVGLSIYASFNLARFFPGNIFRISVSYCLGMTILFFLVRYFCVVFRKLKISIALTYVSFFSIIFHSVISGNILDYNMWVISYKEVTSLIVIFLLNYIGNLMMQTKSFTLDYSSVNAVMKCVGCVHVFRHTNAALSFVESDNIPVLGQCFGQPIVESIYLCIGLKKGALHIWMHIVSSTFITLAFVTALLNVYLDYPIGWAWIVCLIFLFGRESIRKNIWPNAGDITGHDFYATYFDTQNSIIGFLIIIVLFEKNINMSSIPSLFVLCFVICLNFNFTAPKLIPSVCIFLIYDFIVKNVTTGFLYSSFMMDISVVLGILLSLFAGGMFTPKFLKKKNINIHGMMDVYGKACFGFGGVSFFCENNISWGGLVTRNFKLHFIILSLDIAEILLCVLTSVIKFDIFSIICIGIVVFHFVTYIIVNCITVVGMSFDFNRVFQTTFTYVRVAFVGCLYKLLTNILKINNVAIFLILLVCIGLICLPNFIKYINHLIFNRELKKTGDMLHKMCDDIVYIPKTGSDFFDEMKVRVSIEKDKYISIEEIVSITNSGQPLFFYGAKDKGKAYRYILDTYFNIQIDGFIDRNAAEIRKDITDISVMTIDEQVSKHGNVGYTIIITTNELHFESIFNLLNQYNIKDYRVLQVS